VTARRRSLRDSCAPRATALDAHRRDLPKVGEPTRQLLVARRVRPERGGGEQPAQLVEHGGTCTSLWVSTPAITRRVASVSAMVFMPPFPGSVPRCASGISRPAAPPVAPAPKRSASMSSTEPSPASSQAAAVATPTIPVPGSSCRLRAQRRSTSASGWGDRDRQGRPNPHGQRLLRRTPMPDPSPPAKAQTIGAVDSANFGGSCPIASC